MMPRPRFSLRTLLVVVTVVAILAATYRSGVYGLFAFSWSLVTALWLLVAGTKTRSNGLLWASAAMLALTAFFGLVVLTPVTL